MHKLPLLSTLFLGATLLAALGACDPPSGTPGAPQGSAVPSAPASAEGDVLVTVNGVPIRVPDLHFILAREDRGRGRGAEVDQAKAALEKIIDQELTRQAAEARGLDQGPDYLRKLRFMEAPLNDFKRSTLTEEFYKAEVSAKGKVDEAEARKYFEDNSARFKTEVHVLQILIRNDEAKIGELKKELDAGAPFEEVAAKLFPADLPAGDKPPWDMGLLRYNQVPLPWRETLETMKDGQVSDILRGPKNRAWIIKLVKRQLNEAITFEQVAADVIDLLQSAKVANLGAETKRQLRSKAQVVYLREAGAMPPPPEPED